MPIEIERKYIDANLNDVRERLRKLGGTSAGPHFEKNIVFDKEETLLKEGKLLRLRTREWVDGQDCLLTFKSPFESSSARSTGCKVREELELEVGNYQILNMILNKLGYHPVASYEKIRDSWLIAWPESSTPDSCVQMKVDLDILPFCQVVEIEGDPASMDDLACALGLDKSKISTKTYHELHQKWLLANDLPFTPSFTFEPDKRQNIRSILGLNH